VYRFGFLGRDFLIDERKKIATVWVKRVLQF